jgi:hypothetical protein
MVRPKCADAVGNRLEQWFDRALGKLFPHASREPLIYSPFLSIL